MEAAWILVAYASGILMRQIGLPPLVGYLVSGFVLFALNFQATDALEVVAHAGVLLLMFTVGLKLQIRQLIRPEVWGGGICHLLLMSVAFSLGARFLVSDLGIGQIWLLAVACGFSSTVLAAKVLEEKRELRAFHGRVAIGILVIQDLVSILLLGLMVGQAPSAWASILLAFPVLKAIMHRLLNVSGHGELLVLFALFSAIVAGGTGFEYLGLGSELGALVLGAMLADHPRAKELANTVLSLKDVLLVGFFLQIGMSGWPTAESLRIVALLIGFMPIKIALFIAILIAFRLRARTAFLVALSLASYSEFGLIVTNAAVNAGWLGQEWLVTVALAVSVSFAIAAPLNRYAHGAYQRFGSRLEKFETQDRHPDEQPISLGSAHMLIMGMGRVGTAAYDFLKKNGKHVAGLDSDPGKVQQHLRDGRRVLYGDAEDPGFWSKLHLEDVDVVLLAMPDLEAKAIAATQLMRKGFPGVVGAIAFFPDEVEVIKNVGVELVFNYFDEVGVGLAEHVLEAVEANSAAGRT